MTAFVRSTVVLRQILRTALCAACVIAISGCGSDYPKTVQVQGNVTYRGKPLEKAEVQFVPMDSASGQAGRIAIGELAADGSYQLSTYNKGDGVPPGEYRVTVSPLKRKSGVEPGAAATATAQQFPSIYSRFDATPLKATVPADASGTLDLDFELQD